MRAKIFSVKLYSVNIFLSSEADGMFSSAVRLSSLGNQSGRNSVFLQSLVISWRFGMVFWPPMTRTWQMMIFSRTGPGIRFSKKMSMTPRK